MMKWETLLNSARPRPTTSTGDHRAQFERDFDRAVFSTPVRRLQDKTQVFPLDPHDAVRTRLTHSLEVSSVARGLATATAKWLVEQQEIAPEMDRWIEAIAATCGLIHDLGNPPFGHSGEDAIRDWFTKRFGESGLKDKLGDKPQLVNDFLKFEGNAQSLRLVAKLQILADYHGLNLTYATLSASCKYVAPSHEAGLGDDPARKKPGYFASENALIQGIRNATGTGDARNPITFLVEAADDTVYSVADIEDGVKKGILQWDSLEKQLCSEGTDVPQEATAIIAEALERKARILQAGRDSVPADLPDDVHASAFRTATIAIVVNSVLEVFRNRYQEIMDGTYRSELVYDCTAWPLIAVLKDIAKQQVYCTRPTLKLELMGRRVIGDLLDLFWEGAEHLPKDQPPSTKRFSGKVGALLSENYRKVFCHFVEAMPELPECYHRFQLVTDYVCGMTDTFAKRLHAELNNG